MLQFVHHVHYVVKDRDEMIAYLEKNFGMKPNEVLHHKERQIKEALYKVGPTIIQISQPLDPNSGQGKFLAEKGPGVLHVAWGVNDIDKVGKDLADKGNRLRNDSITNSPLGYKAINIDRDQTCGIWLQLAEGEPKLKKA